ncbi:hypothetical protein [Microcoleus sp. CAWBG556]|nr:hypothetical protein [Microcoleus sp. CAWBG556]
MNSLILISSSKGEAFNQFFMVNKYNFRYARKVGNNKSDMREFV